MGTPLQQPITTFTVSFEIQLPFSIPLQVVS